jgi:hypothetical protein
LKLRQNRSLPHPILPLTYLAVPHTRTRQTYNLLGLEVAQEPVYDESSGTEGHYFELHFHYLFLLTYCCCTSTLPSRSHEKIKNREEEKRRENTKKSVTMRRVSMHESNRKKLYGVISVTRIPLGSESSASCPLKKQATCTD